MPEHTAALIAEALSSSRTIMRPDGRTVSYVELGKPTGRPLIHFHGTGFSGIEALTGARAAQDAGVRLIAFDRPGFGKSTPKPNRDLATVASDVLALADQLGIKHFDVSGFSGGVPHALAAAALAGDRCGRVLGVNTAGDVKAAAWRQVPLAARLLVRVMTTRPIARRMWPRLFASIPAMVSPGASPTMASLLEAAFRHGSAGGHDASLDELGIFYQRGWGIPWGDMVSEVKLFHGKQDDLLPFARALARQHLRTTLIEIPGKHMDWATTTVWRRLLSYIAS